MSRSEPGKAAVPGSSMRAFGRRVMVRARLVIIVVVKAVGDVAHIRASPVARVDDLRGWRYPAYLMTGLTELGVVSIRARDLVVAKRILGWHRFVCRTRLDWPGSPTSDLVLSSQPSRDGRRVEVVERYYCEAGPREVHVPYFAHPQFYAGRLHVRCRAMRARQRPIRVLFCGSFEHSAYVDDFDFPMLNRREIVSHLIAMVDSGSGPGGRIVIASSEGHSSLRRPPSTLDAYMSLVASADFSVCPPGIRVPHSHNLIEAMSVGTIPILNYAELVRPALHHGQTCLRFATLEELSETIEWALRQSDHAVREMRRAVIDHYDQMLDPGAFARRVVASAGSIDALLVNAEVPR